MIHVDFNPADIDQIYFPHLEVIGDIAEPSLTRIAAALEGSHHDFTYPIARCRRWFASAWPMVH